MISPHLQAERERLLSAIKSIQASGNIAPANVQIVADFLTKKDFRLANTDLPMKEQVLGQKNSDRYRDWESRIKRRKTLTELEEQLRMLDALIDRQAKATSAESAGVLH